MALNIEILKRFFEGNYTREDFLEIKKSLQNKNNESEIKRLMQKHWEEYSVEIEKDITIDRILDKIQHQIYLEERHKAKRSNLLQIFRRIAAILIVPIILTFGAYLILKPKQQQVNSESYAEIQCPMGARVKFQLPDGTSGFLNSGSSLKYPVVFNETRQVFLSGEAYFDVTPSRHSPFQVQTSNIIVHVLGTKFNIISWPDENVEEVVLESGHLNVNLQDGKPITELFPNQKLSVDLKNQTGTKTNVVASQYTGWKEGKLIFRNEHMEEVAKRLSRWYNADIIIADKELNQYSIHATFEDERLNEVLKLVSLTTPIIYEEEERDMSSEGVVSKRRIILKINPQKKNLFK